MTDWATFAAATVALTLLLLSLTRRSQRTLKRVRIVDSRSDVAVGGDHTTEFERTTAGGAAAPDVSAGDTADPESNTADDDPVARPSQRRDEPVLTTATLLANAALSQLLALIVLIGIAWWTAVPVSAFGVGGEGVRSISLGPLTNAAWFLGIGTAVGIALYVGNEAVARLGTRVGVSPSTRLREAMAPEDARGWALLLGVVLPIIAVFEEALFRGALIGALAVGFAIDPWVLAVGSSVAFGFGHGAQGRFGIAVTALLGFGLAAVFILTGSLFVVIVAHYVVNALEFVVHEKYEIELG